MKVALFHDYLNQYGGAERVLEVLMEMFPEAPIYTLLYDEVATKGRFRGRKIITSKLNFPFVRKYHRLFIPLMPLAISLMRPKELFDLVISDTAGFAKGIRVPASTFHLSYVHTPLRYAWETKTYFGHSLKTRLFNFFFRPAFAYVRRFDLKSAAFPNTFLTNSEYISNKIRSYYGREAKVVYPPVRQEVFFYDPKLPQEDYFLAFGRLLHYKNFDLILKAFETLPYRLVIAGAGPKAEMLREMAKPFGSRIQFLDFIPDDAAVRELYTKAKALIFPQVEDFGLIAAEAQACGTPVIALKAGGALEIVKDGETGLFFDVATPESLREAIFCFEGSYFDRKSIAKTAERFGEWAFRKGILDAIPDHLRSLLT